MKSAAHNLIKKISLPLSLVVIFLSLVSIQIFASDDTTFNQVINEGTLDVAIVDAGGSTVSSPSVTFGAVSFSYSAQNATGTLGTGTEKIRLSNPTATETWSVTMAATSGAGTPWTDGTYSYPFDDVTSADNGRLTVDPSVGTITPLNSCTITGVTKGTSDTFISGSVGSIDLMGAAANADVACQWDLTGISLTQRIPASQAPSNSYSISMTITAT